jgi:hypothetical protein
LHYRALPETYKFETSDERLNGTSSGLNNYDIVLESDQETWKSVGFYGISTITSDEPGKDILWLCTHTAVKKEGGVTIVNFVCSGNGVNKGLKAEVTLTGNNETPTEYELKGVITE